MMPLFWYLDGHTPISTDDVMEWTRHLPKGRQSSFGRVAQDDIGEVYVSTVFLGIDHNFEPGPPLLFETMVFGGPMDQGCWRYSTWEEAEAGHRRVVKVVRSGTSL